MNEVVTDILITIFTSICSTDIPIDSNRLLDYIEDKSWQKELINSYFRISLVCTAWDKIICERMMLPFHTIRSYYNTVDKVTLLSTRYHNIRCINLISQNHLSESCISLGTDTKYIVWDNKLVNHHDIITKVECGKITLIGFPNYRHLLAEYQYERDNLDIEVKYYQQYVGISASPGGGWYMSPKWLTKYMPGSLKSLAKLYALLDRKKDKLLCRTIKMKTLSFAVNDDQDKRESIEFYFQTKVHDYRSMICDYISDQIV